MNRPPILFICTRFQIYQSPIEFQFMTENVSLYQIDIGDTMLNTVTLKGEKEVKKA